MHLGLMVALVGLILMMVSGPMSRPNLYDRTPRWELLEESRLKSSKAGKATRWFYLLQLDNRIGWSNLIGTLGSIIAILGSIMAIVLGFYPG